MCGIAGLFHVDGVKPVDPARLAAMAEAQAHRGPDGQGVWTGRGIGLAHRRLAIIDLAGSPQPMASADGRLVVTYNGEIYNYRGLRRELEGLGAVFRTEGDTEVLLEGWRRWREGLLPRLNGMFAFALWDEDRQALFLARDRLGVKPLHWARLPDGSIAFASELKGLLAHPAFRRQLDPRAIEDYFTWGYVPDDACLLAGVEKLAAGHHLTLTRGRAVPPPTCWWRPDFSRRAGGSTRDLAAELKERLRDAVASRMVADVPVGAFLSGGVDSSAVVALMAGLSTRPVETCSIGFDAAAEDETRWARLVADRFATRHRTRVVGADDHAQAGRLAAMFDEPFADASALGTWRVAQLARETVTVALSGDGADEAFAGYRRHAFHALEARGRRLLPDRWRTPVFGRAAALYPKADWAPRPFRLKTTLAALATDEAEAYAAAVGVTPPDTRARLFTPALRRALGGHRGEDRWVAAMRDAPARDPLDRAQFADLTIWLPGDILTKVDRTTMATSLEAREPLLDHRLIEFAATLPSSLRVRGMSGKWLMKRALAPLLPPEILHRRKQGFVTPVSRWFRGPLAGEARALVRLADTGWFERDAIARVAEAHIAGVRDHGRLLWQLTMFERSLKILGW